MESKPLIIGIAGGTCSGKSTLADRLEEDLMKTRRITVFHMDKYFKRPSPTTIAPITRVEYVEHNHPDTLDLDLLYTDFFAAADDRSETSPEIILIEGLFALYLDPIRERLDLKVFVDLKSDERLVRRIKKFMQRGQSMDEITARYLDTVRYRHDELIEPSRWHADIVINGTLDANKGSKMLHTYLNHLLDQPNC